jgi:hypothetical protein
MHNHALYKHRWWCRGGMNPYGPTPSRVKSALSVNMMRSRKKIIIFCAVPRTSLTELSSSKFNLDDKDVLLAEGGKETWFADGRLVARPLTGLCTMWVQFSLCWSQGDQQLRDVFFIWQTRRAEQATMHIRWHTEREPTSSVRRIGSPRG